MRLKKQFYLPTMIASLTLIAAFTTTLTLAPSVDGLPSVPAEPCDAAHAGDFGYVTLRACGQGGNPFILFNAWVCEENGAGGFSWQFIEERCEPTVPGTFTQG